tara:strand:- start:14921 stop:17617 length:2697 start_codon:yes stop_codon:yes gene_type:complete
MKLKEREKGNLSRFLDKSIKVIKKNFLNKKIRIVLLLIILLIVFIIGMFSGLLVSGFLGSFDDPSQNAIDLMHSFGITGLQELKTKIERIKNENIKIPFNYLIGQFSNPERIYIDIAWDDYQKLEYKRQQALEAGALISSGEDYVPATIRYKDQSISTKLRLKGDWLDHLEGEKWSFRIKIKGDKTLFGMNTFSIQKPKSRGYIASLIYYVTNRKEGVMSLRYDFIEVVINGENKGIYNIEEHFDKIMIEDNQRREGVILKFSEDVLWEETVEVMKFIPNKLDIYNYQWDRSFSLFDSSKIEPLNNKVLEDPILHSQFIKSKNLLELFRNGELRTSQAFDVDLMAKYFALSTLFGTNHPAEWRDIRFFYNPITSKLEPIAYDGDLASEPLYVLDSYFGGEWMFFNKVFKDQIFIERYIQELERISNKEYADKIYSELNDEVERTKKIIYKDEPTYVFSDEILYNNIEIINFRLNSTNNLNAFFQRSLPLEDKVVISVGNIDYFPLEIVSLQYRDNVFKTYPRILQPKEFSMPINYNKIEFNVDSRFSTREDFSSNLVINYRIIGSENIKKVNVNSFSHVEDEFLEEDVIRQESNFSEFSFLNINENLKRIYIKKGNWVLDKSLIIPKGFSVYCEGGTNIDLIDNSLIISYSDFQFLGVEEEMIRIFSSDNTGQGIVILNTEKESNFQFVEFSNLTNPSKESWLLTGAITFHRANFNFDNVIIKNINAEDSLDGVGSSYNIRNSRFENCFSDCFDDDFGGGIIKDTLFINSGNDGIDISGAKTNIIGVEIINAGDKAISGGEKSNLIINNLKITKAYVGVASKDNSNVSIINSEISNSKYGLAVYQKKQEFGPALINANEITFLENDNQYIIESGSDFNLNNKIILNFEKNVYLKLYPE